MRCKSTRLARSFDSMKKRFLKIVIGIVFAIVLPINAGNITFYDVNRNTVEYWNNPL